MQLVSWWVELGRCVVMGRVVGLGRVMVLAVWLVGLGGLL